MSSSRAIVKAYPAIFLAKLVKCFFAIWDNLLDLLTEAAIGLNNFILLPYLINCLPILEVIFFKCLLFWRNLPAVLITLEALLINFENNFNFDNPAVINAKE